MCCVTEKLTEKVSNKLDSLLRNFRFFVLIFSRLFGELCFQKVSWKPQAASVAEKMITRCTNLGQFKKSGASGGGELLYRTY